MAAVVLNGITWGHSRGITPLLAVSQRYSELHPEVEIRWKKRTLQEFADYPIDILHWDQGAENNPSLKEGRKFLGKIIPMGGVDEMIFGNNAEEKIAQLTRKCVEENKDIPYVLAPYCSVSVHSSDAEMRAFRENADALIKK